MGSLRFFAILFLFIVVLQFSQAKLEIINDDNFTIVGDVGESIILEVEVENTGTRDLYNVTLENSEHIRNPEIIEELQSGQIKTLQFTVYVTEGVSLELDLEGVYVEDIGTSDESFLLEIYNEDQAGIPVEYRNFNVYVGDEITFANYVSDWVDLYDVETSTQIRKINEGENYTKFADTPEEISYVIRRRGTLDLTSIFTLNVLPTTGAVHDPLLDDVLYITIDPTYEPTIISPTFIDTDFSLEFYKTTETAFVLKNTGDENAYVELSGDWMTFSKNDFMIEPDQSVSVTLTIDLDDAEEEEFDDTNMTNKTYTKYLKVNGNFPSISKAMNIFIQYTEIIDGEVPLDASADIIEDLSKLLKTYCIDNPDDPLCGTKYYTGYDPDTDIITLNGSRYSIQELLSAMYDTKDTVEESTTIFGDKIDSFESRLSEVESGDQLTMNQVETELTQLRDSNSVTNTIIISFILSFVVAIVMISSIYYKRFNERKKKVRGQFN